MGNSVSTAVLKNKPTSDLLSVRTLILGTMSSLLLTTFAKKVYDFYAMPVQDENSDDIKVLKN
jgi:hypothetical protein